MTASSCNGGRTIEGILVAGAQTADSGRWPDLSGRETTLGVQEHLRTLLASDIREPLQELAHAGAAFEVLKECLHRNAGALE